MVLGFENFFSWEQFLKAHKTSFWYSRKLLLLSEFSFFFIFFRTKKGTKHVLCIFLILLILSKQKSAFKNCYQTSFKIFFIFYFLYSERGVYFYYGLWFLYFWVLILENVAKIKSSLEKKSSLQYSSFFLFFFKINALLNVNALRECGDHNI